jgi:hypothetical protein
VQRISRGRALADFKHLIEVNCINRKHCAEARALLRRSGIAGSPVFPTSR